MERDGGEEQARQEAIILDRERGESYGWCTFTFGARSLVV